MVKKILGTILIMLLSVASNAQVAQTPHNLTGISGNLDNTQLCIYCHIAPSDTKTFKSPLWDKTAPQTGFSMYKERASDSQAFSDPNTFSMLCLSCHDGASSANSVVNITGTVATSTTKHKSVRLAGGLSVGSYGDFDDHPVSIEYIPGGKSSLRPINEPLIGEWNGANTIADLLRNGKVECGSCHDPHYEDPKGIFLRNKNENSEMCLSCHDK